MSKRDGSDQSKARLALTAFSCATIGIIVGLALAWSAEIRSGREDVERRASAYCANKRECNQGDLESQIRAADAAETGVDFGLVQFLVSTLGLLGLGFTVVYARNAWVESERAANAASDTLEHARSVSIAELRPWITVTAKPTLIRFTSDGIDFRYSLIFQNLGSTVALNFCAFHHFFFESRRADKTIAGWLAEMRSNIPEPNTVLMPGEVWEYPLRSPVDNPIPWQNFTNGKSMVIPVITVVAFYRSGIDKEWKETHRTFQIFMANEDSGLGGILKRDGVWRAEDLMAHNRGAVIAT